MYMILNEKKELIVIVC